MSDSVGSVSVEVVPDARGWSEKLRSQLRDQKVTINANADTTEADAQLDEAARTRTATIKADTSQLSKGNDALGGFVDKLGIMPALAVAAGAALVPLAATIGGLTAAIAAPLVVAGGGVGLFAVLAGFAVKDTEKQLKNIDTLQKKLTGLTKGTKEYVQTQQELKAAQAALTPAQKQFESSLTGVGDAFQSLIAGKSGQAMLGVVSQALDLLAKSLPIVSPLLGAVSHTFGQLLGELGDAAEGKGFADFIHRMAHQVGPDLTSFAHILGNFTVGLGGLFGVLDKKQFSGGILDGLEGLSKQFRDFGTGSGGQKAIRQFFDYFHRVAPGVGSSIGAVAQAIGHIAHALAPLGPVVFKGLELAADALSKIPIPVLTALAAATVGLTGFSKLGGFKATGFALNKLTSGSGIAGGLIGATKVVPVYVTNEGFGGPGGGKGLFGKVKDALPTAAGGAEGTAALTAPEIAAMAGIFAVGVGAQTVLTQSERHGFANYGQHTVTPPGMYGNGTGYTDPPGQQHFKPPPLSGGIPITNALIASKKAQEAMDALRTHAAGASQTIDRIGPNATASLAGAIHTVGVLQGHIDNLHDKRLSVIANTQGAVHSLEALQAMTIRDKHFTVTELFQQRERNVGPGGGIQHHASGGFISGAGTGLSDSIPSYLSNGEFVVNASATTQHRRLLEQLNRGTYHHTAQLARYATMQGGLAGGSGNLRITGTLNTPWGPAQVEGIAERAADRVYHANRSYEDQAAGR